MAIEPDELTRQIEADRRQRLRLSLAASGSADLLPLLDAAAGGVVQGYRLVRLLAAGGQFFVWDATTPNTNRPVIIKHARFDFRHPVRYSRAEVQRLRATVRREEEVLWADRSGTLPKAIALLEDDSPIPAARAAPALAVGEVFVVQEWIRGLTLTELSLRVWPNRPPAVREAAVARLAAGFVEFWTLLRSANWFYGDLSAENMLVEPSGKFRVVDAGSAVPAAAEVFLGGFTPAFTTPRLYAAASGGRPVPGTLSSVLPALSKVIHFGLTGREQFNGRPADLTEPALERYSPACRLVLELLAGVDDQPEEADTARDALLNWAADRGEMKR